MSKDNMGDGPYRVGNHSPLNVWCEPGQSTHEQVCMATSPRWAGRIVAALNEQDARSVGEQAVSDAVASAHLSGVDLPADWVETLGKVARGEVTADGAVQAVVESSLRDMIEAALCGGGEEQYDVHVTHAGIAETVMAVVAPMLAAKDAALGWEQSSKQQYVDERDEALDDVERLRSALSKALADLVVRRQALANVLGVTDAGGVSGYYRMIQDVADVRAELGAIRARAQLAEDERDKANRQNESLARRLHLRFQNEQKLSAELEQWRTGPLVVLDAPLPTGQPDTEATEQARCARCEHYEHQSSCATDCMACPPCTSTFTIAGRTHRCALRGSHKESLHLNNIRKHDTVWDDDQADSAPVTPTELRAVYHEPGDVQYEYDEDDNPTDPSVGWDLTFGCRVSFSHDSDGYRATVSISDQTQRDGLAVRGVTRDQIRAYAYQLIRLTEVTEDGTQ